MFMTVASANQARLFRSSDRGVHWKATPIAEPAGVWRPSIDDVHFVRQSIHLTLSRPWSELVATKLTRTGHERVGQQL